MILLYSLILCVTLVLFCLIAFCIEISRRVSSLEQFEAEELGEDVIEYKREGKP